MWWDALDVQYGYDIALGQHRVWYIITAIELVISKKNVAPPTPLRRL